MPFRARTHRAAQRPQRGRPRSSTKSTTPNTTDCRSTRALPRSGAPPTPHRTRPRLRGAQDSVEGHGHIMSAPTSSPALEAADWGEGEFSSTSTAIAIPHLVQHRRRGTTSAAPGASPNSTNKRPHARAHLHRPIPRLPVLLAEPCRTRSAYWDTATP